MANYFARKAGNINAVDVWATTPSGTAADVWSTFTSADTLHSNSFAITVNVSTMVGTVRNDNANSATAGGSFTLSNGVTLTANVVAGGVTCVSYSGTSGNSATIVGNLTGGTSTNANGASNASSGTLNITGNCTGGSGGSSRCAFNASSGTINITGSVTGSSAAVGEGAYNSSTGTINITGNVTGGGLNTSYGATNISTGTMTITGNVTGGSVSGSDGARNASTGTLTIIGTSTASNNAAGSNNISTGILNVTRAVGNGWGIGTVGISSIAGVVSAVAGSQTRVEEFEFGALGQAPVSGAVSTPDLTTNVALVRRLGTTKKTLSDPSASTGMPNESDVRSGTSYALGNRTGTMAVPSTSSVAFGVLVDNTTGTAVLTPENVWNTLTSSMTTSGSIGARLKNAATTDIVLHSISDAIST
jgi:hypothetical protein